MKRLFTIFLCLLYLSLPVAAQDAKENKEVDLLGLIFQRIIGGQGSVAVSSYGNSETFTIDGVNHLHRFINYVSIADGPVEIVYPPNWAVAVPITVAGDTGVSSVRKGNTLQIDYTYKIVDNTGGLVDWLLTVTLRNLTTQALNVCYYAYLDYDLFESFAGDVATYDAVDLDLNVPTLRVQKVEREGVFILSDVNNLSRDWRIGVFPTVLDFLESAVRCLPLGATVSPFGPEDFTSALQFPVLIPVDGSVSLNLRMGRYQ